MKRILLFSIIMVLAFTLLFTVACKGGSEEIKPEDVTPADIYAVLTTLSQKDYSELSLSVVTTENGKSLSGTYEVAKQGETLTVNYSYQQFATFKLVDSELVAPDSEIETLSGTLTERNGKIVDSSGAELNVSVNTLSTEGFTFNKDCLTVISESDSQFKAAVTDAKTFMGLENVTDMTASVDFSESAISKITVEYKKGNASVILTYTLK